ncbi:MAG: hypothetical protein EBS01_03515, partial [Verrucomicrobia bacterium]|nr:hypothetical protein [Verrucomicrobiota bacterium]
SINEGVLAIGGVTAASLSNVFQSPSVAVGTGTLGLLVDGNGTSTPESLYFAKDISYSGAAGLIVGRFGGNTSGLFNQAVNKTVQAGTLTLGGSSFTVTANNGYGLDFGTIAALPTTSTMSFVVNGAQPSDTVQGLTLSGTLSGGTVDTGLVVLSKQGTGSLVLGNSLNSFGSADTIVDIAAGILQIGSVAALGASGSLRISTGLGTQGLRASDTFTFSKSLVLNGGSSGLDVVAGKTLTLSGPLYSSAPTNVLQKNDAGTLLITSSNPTFTGSISVASGVFAFNSTSGTLGSAVFNVMYSSPGAAIQISGGTTVGYALNMGTATSSGSYGVSLAGFNTQGALQSVSGVNTWSGSIALVQDAVIAANAGSTLNLTGGVVGASRVLSVGGDGTMNITGTAFSGLLSFAKIGSGMTTVGVSLGNLSGSAGSPLLVAGGTLVLNASGSLGSGSTVGVTVNPGARLLVDDSVTQIASRLGGRGLTLNGGAFIYTGSLTGSGTSVETVGALTLGSGQSLITNNLANVSSAGSLTFASLTAGAGSTVDLGGTLGTATSSIRFTTTPTSYTNNLLPRFIFGGTDFVSIGSFGLVAFGSYNGTSSTDLNAAATTDTLKITSGFTTTSLTASRTLNALAINGSGLTVGAAAGTPYALTLSTGNMLVTGGANTLAAPVLALGASEGLVYANAGASLTITGGISGTAGLTVAGSGSVVLSGTNAVYSGMGGNVYSGITTVSGGTLFLAGGVNTLFPGSNISVNPGGVLNLNGTSQVFADFVNSAARNGVTDGAGGIITGTANSLLISNQSNTARTFIGSMTGAMGFVKSGLNTLNLEAANSYTGNTLINGGAVYLRDSGALASGTITVNFASLILDNTGYRDMADRILDSSTLYLNGATVAMLGRAQTASSETLGNVQAVSGVNYIYAGTGGTGINSADLTVGLSRSSGSSSVVNFANSGATAGQIASGLIGSSNPRVLLSSGSAVTNYILGPWALVGREFASYSPTYGVAALNAPGYAGYSSTTLSSANVSTDNVRITASPSPLTAATMVNTLNVNAAGSIAVDLGGNKLTLAGGGLLFGQVATGNLSFSNGTLTSGISDLYVHVLPIGGTNRNFFIGAGIADGGSSVRLIVSSSESSGGANGLTLSGLNSYSGGTVVNGGSVVLGGTAVLGIGGITLNAGAFTQAFGGTLGATPQTVTLNGGGTLTLVGSNTIQNLLLNSIGGSGPSANLGLLTVASGSLAATSANVSQPSALTTGVIDFGATGGTLAVSPVAVNGQSVAPLTAGLNVASGAGFRGSGALNITGGGVTQLTGAYFYTGTTNVGAGSTVQFGAAGGGSPLSRLNLASSNSLLNLNGFSSFVASLTGSGVITNSSTTAGSLTVGYDNSSTTFSGQIQRFSNAGNYTTSTGLVKAGSGSLTLTGSSNSSGALTVSRGSVVLSGSANTSFLTNTVNVGGTLLLDNSTANFANRLAQGNVAANTLGTSLVLGGGNFILNGGSNAPTVETLGNLIAATGSVTSGGSTVTVVSTAGLYPGMVITVGTLFAVGTTITSISGNTLTMGTIAVGAAPAGTSITFASAGALSLLPGGSTITLGANSAQSLTLNTGIVGAITAGADLLLRGPNLGATLGAGTAQLLAYTAAPALIGAGGTVGTVTMSIRPDILADTSATGNGFAFATYIGATGTSSTGGSGFRPLVSGFTSTTELASYLTASGSGNIQLYSSVGGYLSSSSSVNSLTLASGGAYTAAGTLADALVLTPTSGGVLALGGSSTLSGGQIAAPSAGMFFWTPGASTTLNLNSAVTGGNAFTKDGAGILNVGVRQLYTGVTYVNGGTLLLAGGNDRLFVSALGAGNGLVVNNGVLDLGGNNQTVAAFSSSNPTPGVGGFVTSSSGGTLTSTGGGTFAGQLSGTLSFTRSGGTNSVLISNNTFTGATTIRGGNLNIQQGGQLSGTTQINNYFGTLNLDNATSATFALDRVNNTAPLTLQGASVVYTGFPGADSAQNIGAVTLQPGISTLTSTRGNAGGNAALTLAGLNRNAGSMVNFTAGSGVLGSSIFGNSQILLSSGSALTNNILGGWAIANSADFATYLTANGTVAGVGALGQTGGYAQYTTTALSSNALTSADNILMSANATLLSGGTTVNSLKMSGTAITLTISSGNTLTLASGGLITTTGTGTISGGTITSGGPELFAYT